VSTVYNYQTPRALNRQKWTPAKSKIRYGMKASKSARKETALARRFRAWLQVSKNDLLAIPPSEQAQHSKGGKSGEAGRGFGNWHCGGEAVGGEI
jgi:hypothetical protein